jgi:F-box interacting protein
MKFLKKKIMLMKKNKDRKKKKQLRKVMLSSTISQNHLVNVVEEEAKKKRLQSNTLILPDELIAEIISVLNIKTIVRLKCVSKSWNILISDPTFVEKHLSKSSQNPHLLLTPLTWDWEYPMSSVVSLPVSRLLKNQSSTVSGDNCHGWANTVHVVGTCKGLLCLLFRVDQTYWFRLWNPATRTISIKLGTSHDYNTFKFSFGCDILTGTYKVVAYQVEKDEENDGSWRSQVKIFSFSDKCWKNIDSFPLIPITCIQFNPNSDGVHLSGTVNWLTLGNYFNQFMIVSLDLSTETYTQFLLPSGFDEVPHFQPTLHVLMDFLCFSHDFKRTEFVIWQMKEFGVQESWTQLFRIDYINLQMDNLPVVINNNMGLNAGIFDCNTPLFPLHLSKNGDTLILANGDDNHAIIYNGRDKSVERIRVSYKVWLYSSMNYVESLVSPPWK